MAVSWAPYQVQRIREEIDILAIELPDFLVYELDSGALYVYGRWVSNGDYPYEIRIELPAGYPDECPDTYIVRPTPLYDHAGRDMRSHGTSHEYHVWDGGGGLELKICTFRPQYWDAGNSLVQLVHKAFLWILAFEEHRETGKRIDKILLDMS